MVKAPSLKELRERLRLQQAINRELERTARLEERIARARARPSTSTRRIGKTRPGAKPASKGRRARSTTKPPRPRQQRRPAKSRRFEALHPRDARGHFIQKVPKQQRVVPGLRRWALFLKPAHGPKKYPNQVIVLILDENPAKMNVNARGAWVREIRKARKLEDPKLKWLVEQGSGPWLDPTMEPGTWWVETRHHLD